MHTCHVAVQEIMQFTSESYIKHNVIQLLGHFHASQQLNCIC